MFSELHYEKDRMPGVKGAREMGTEANENVTFTQELQGEFLYTLC